jgi:hypothetical protein
MSEVDRLSNSGLYPALPVSDRQQDKGQSSAKHPPQPPAKPDPTIPDTSNPNSARPPKSIIDEYA